MRSLLALLALTIAIGGCQPAGISQDRSPGSFQTAVESGMPPLSGGPGEASAPVTPASSTATPISITPEWPSATPDPADAPTGGAPATGGEAEFFALGRQAAGTVSIQNVSLVNQENYTSCGEAAFVMAWNYRHSDQRLTLDAVETAALKIGVYYPASLPGPHGYRGTSPAGMQAIGEVYASKYRAQAPLAGNLNLDNGDAYAQQEAIGLLFSQLSAGYPVIIEATDIIGDPSRTINDSHYVVVTGMDFDARRVTYNDPYLYLSTSGKYSGGGRTADWSEVWASWSANRDILPGTNLHAGRGWYMVVR